MRASTARTARRAAVGGDGRPVRLARRQRAGVHVVAAAGDRLLRRRCRRGHRLQGKLIDYINRFIADLANSGADIARPLDEVEARGNERLLGLAARPEASEAVPDGADAAEAFGRAEAGAPESWRNRWRGLRDWFVSGGPDRPSQARLLRRPAVTAIEQHETAMHRLWRAAARCAMTEVDIPRGDRFSNRLDGSGVRAWSRW
ncbi:DUF2397 family protein [Actinomadura madurae]|uniref:DUF2397 family protein n=1 Tax=Actinomadura madurae TaxID=1993 RepID=UPI000945455C|nr:DUF2397 family protein [Actinomadura madurae]